MRRSSIIKIAIFLIFVASFAAILIGRWGASGVAEADIARDVFEAINAVRAEHGVEPLGNCSLLSELAWIRARRVARHLEETGRFEQVGFEEDLAPYADRLGEVVEVLYRVEEGYACFIVCVPLGVDAEELARDAAGKHGDVVLGGDYRFGGVGAVRVGRSVVVSILFSTDCS